jgi:hypothetical protein
LVSLSLIALLAELVNHQVVRDPLRGYLGMAERKPQLLSQIWWLEQLAETP